MSLYNWITFIASHQTYMPGISTIMWCSHIYFKIKFGMVWGGRSAGDHMPRYSLKKMKLKGNLMSIVFGTTDIVEFTTVSLPPHHDWHIEEMSVLGVEVLTSALDQLHGLILLQISCMCSHCIGLWSNKIILFKWMKQFSIDNIICSYLLLNAIDIT